MINHIFFPILGAGIYYYSDKLFAGASIPDFLNYQKKYFDRFR